MNNNSKNNEGAAINLNNEIITMAKSGDKKALLNSLSNEEKEKKVIMRLTARATRAKM